MFLASALAIVPLAGLMGDATEALARFLGPTVGGLLNATLGNAPEIIISSLCPPRGPGQHREVFADGLDPRQPALRPRGLVLRRRDQVSPESDSSIPRSARMTTALLTLASFGLIIPAVTQFSASASRSISRETAVVLFLVYLASLVAIFWNRKPLIGKEGVKANLKEKAERPDEVSEEPEAGWSRNKALVILAAVTIGLAIMSEVLTGAIEPASESLHLTPAVRRGLLARPGRQRRRALQRGPLRPQGPDGPVPSESRRAPAPRWDCWSRRCWCSWA